MTEALPSANSSDGHRPVLKRVGRRFVVLVVLFSSVITLVLTTIQLYLDYRNGLADIDAQMMEVKQVHLANIADSLWVADLESLQLQLRGIEKLPDMQYLAIYEDGELAVEAGKFAKKNTVQREYPVEYTHLDVPRQIGSLTVVATLDGVYRRLFDKAATILISNAIKTFLVAGFMLAILGSLVTRPLAEFAEFLQRYNGSVSIPDFVPETERKRNDELNVVFQSFNDLNRRLDESFVALRDSESQFRELAENVGDLVWVESPDMQTIRYVNPAYEKIWGRTAESLLQDASSWTDALDEQARSDVVKAIEGAKQKLESGTPETVKRLDFPTYTVTRPDGTKRIVFARLFPVWNDAGEVERIVGLGTDITELHEAQRDLLASEERLRKSQKLEAIGQLTGGVAHDFNNLLAVILGNLEFLQDGEQDTEKLEFIDAAIGAVGRGSDLTRNMLSFARQAALEPKILDLNAITRSTKNWIGRTLPSNIEVETSLLAGIWKIEADIGSTQSALINLILNARDAMPNGGKLTIETANIRVDQEYIETRLEEMEPGRYVMLAVSDTGHGIPKEIQDEVFEPFFTTKAPGSGSGLGLSMVLGFLKQSGGTARIYSEPGVGTTVKLYFKAMADNGRDDEVNQSDIYHLRLGKEKILVAEDEPEVLRLLIGILGKAGYNVRAASSGDEAIKIFADDPSFDMLLTDIVMPGELQGTKLAKVLRAQRPDLPVVFMSGYAEEATVHGNGLRPEDIRLMKPVSRKDLLNAIARALSGEQTVD